MFRTLFTIVCMSIFVTPVFAEIKLTPRLYTFDDFFKKYSDGGIQLDAESGRILSASWGSSKKEILCRALGNINKYFKEDMNRSEDGLSYSMTSHGNIVGYIISTNDQYKKEVINRIRTKTRIEETNIEYGKKFLRCKRKRITQGRNIIQYSNHVSGNIGFKNIQSKQIKIIDYGGIHSEDNEGGLWLFIVIDIKI